ncbi:Uncharacterised protein [Mycobacteroides abscessus subsp. abscessus]|nr:Uncharacterised protein [Mycobacteroides abscessus subsp. abscessus]
MTATVQAIVNAEYRTVRPAVSIVTWRARAGVAPATCSSRYLLTMNRV